MSVSLLNRQTLTKPYNATYVPVGPAISGDTTGVTDLASVQATLDAAAGGGIAQLTRPGTYMVNGPLSLARDAHLILGPKTVIKAVGTFPSTSDLLQDAPPTTIAAGSDGASTSANTVNVGSTTLYPATGQFRVAITGGTAVIAYTGKTATSFTGCTSAGGAAGTFATGNPVSARTYNGRITGGGILDSNNLARHGLWLHHFAGFTVELTAQNSTSDDIVLGDTAAVASSYGAMIGNGSGGVLVDRTAGLIPAGHSALWVTSACSDTQLLGRVVVKGQETGLTCDGSDVRGCVHAWASPDANGNGMHVSVTDNGLDNALDVIADTPSVYGLQLGVSQDRGNHRGVIFLNSLYGVDNVVVAIRSNGSGTNVLDFTCHGASNSIRLAAEYGGNYGHGRTHLRSTYCVSAFRRNLYTSDDVNGSPAQTLLGSPNNAVDLERWYSQNNGVLGPLLGGIDSKGQLYAPAVRAVRQSYLRPTAATYETIPRTAGLSSGSALTSGTLLLVAIELPMGLQVNSMTFLSGNTALAGGTHLWAALLDSSRVFLAESADDTAPSWGSFAAKTFSVAAAASGAASSFTTTYTGLHYLGLMVAATTVPTLTGSTPGTLAPGLAPVLYGNSDTGQAAPPGFPHTASAITSINVSAYAYVS